MCTTDLCTSIFRGMLSFIPNLPFHMRSCLRSFSRTFSTSRSTLLASLSTQLYVRLGA